MVNLLIIDEDKFFIDSISYFLTNEGFNVDSCYNGKVGLEKIFSGDYDLVICNTQLEHKNGFEISNIIKQNLATSHTVVILIAPSNNIIAIDMNQELTYDSYLQKPVIFQNLLDAIIKNLHLEYRN